ncbi:MAG: class I SAM-dependent methyltransferase [Candidatus Paceibacterota bacterium]|jgi:ubiquinone/menaquinone biosynthesis C-methylase UbiE
MAINSNLLRKNRFIIEKIRALSMKRAREVAGEIEEHLNPKDLVLDIGAGNCNVTEALMDDGYEVTAIDVKNLSLAEDIRPVIYDGNTIPFKNKQFDVALILFVLHHTKNPIRILSEAARVSEKIIVMEDVFDNDIGKYVTFAVDSILNQEFFGHPHSNMSDSQWKNVFSKLHLSVEFERTEKWRLLIDHATYCLRDKS